MCFPLANVHTILKVNSEPRALGVSLLNPDVGGGYLNAILITKKNYWSKRKHFMVNE